MTRGVNGSGFENETNFSLIKHFGPGGPIESRFVVSMNKEN